MRLCKICNAKNAVKQRKYKKYNTFAKNTDASKLIFSNNVFRFFKTRQGT